MEATFKYFSLLLICITMFSLSTKANAECIKGNCINGQGTFTAANGDKYDGEFRDGKYNGQGIFNWAGGQKYDGEFRGNQANGQGTFTSANGDKYDGQFKDNKYHGQGTLTFQNGTIKSGVWKNGGYLGTKAEWEAKERDRMAREEQAREEAKEKREEAKEKYDSIYLACLLDKSIGLDMQMSAIRNAIEETCTSIADDPSWLENFKYN